MGERGMDGGGQTQADDYDREEIRGGRVPKVPGTENPN